MNASNWKGTASKRDVERIMIAHLETLGWPNIPNPNERILGELRVLYAKLEEAGLMPLSFAEFEDTAMSQYFFAEMM